MMLLTALATALLGAIPTPSAPSCSINSDAGSMQATKVFNFKAGGYDRCTALLVPPNAGKSLPILFVAHGAGGNAHGFPKMKDQAGGNTWGDVALKHGFAVVGVEALQFSTSPSPPSPPSPPAPPGPPGTPAPVAADCVQCFVDAGCKAGATCDSCCKAQQQNCAQTCMKNRVPFSDAEAAVCGSANLSETEASWHGGQWLLPEVQNDTTGIVCDATNAEIAYFTAAIDALKNYDGATLDTSRIFFTGCSMGSALTVWAAQCFHAQMPTAVTAFGTQSTGLKVKGDGLRFPPDNYDSSYTWGECPTCKYFPAPVVKTSGLKACINDQTGDGDFYKSSLALDAAWKAKGMRSNATYHDGKHCQTYSFEDIALCMDDGTGRLLTK